MRKLKHRQVTYLGQTHTSYQGQILVFRPGVWSESLSLQRLARLPTHTSLVLKLAGIRIIWKDYCLALNDPQQRSRNLHFLTSSQLMLKLGSGDSLEILLCYHTLNMRLMWTRLASIFPLAAEGRRVCKSMGHFKAHLANLSCFSYSYTFYLRIKCFIWEAGSFNMKRYFHFLCMDYSWLMYFKMLHKQRISDGKGSEDLAKVVKTLGTQCNRSDFNRPFWHYYRKFNLTLETVRLSKTPPQGPGNGDQANSGS